MRWFVIGLVLIFIISGCSARSSSNNSSTPTKQAGDMVIIDKSTDAPDSSKATSKPEQNSENQEENKNTVIADLAKEVIDLIKNKQFKDLSIFVHPDKGLRFSPYGNVNTKTDRIFTSEEVAGASANKTKYIWGSYDGSGEPIDLAFAEYYGKFIYDKDFVNAPEIAYDKVIGKGNTTINYAEAYPNSKMVEYHFPSFDKKNEGMDWESLRLIFEQKDGAWYLIAIIHDQWTI